jgi:hypothetical protein
VKDWQRHRIATVFGAVRLRLPRFLCADCGSGTNLETLRSRCAFCNGAIGAGFGYRLDRIANGDVICEGGKIPQISGWSQPRNRNNLIFNIFFGTLLKLGMKLRL